MSYDDTQEFSQRCRRGDGRHILFVRNAGRRLGPTGPTALAGNGERKAGQNRRRHCLFHESLDLVSDEIKATMPQMQTRGTKEHFIVVEERLKAMDAMGIDMEVLSINPIFWYGQDRDNARKIVDIQNAKLTELCAQRPDRLAGFASLALQFPDLAVQQLEYAMKK